MSWGERSCSQANAPKNEYGYCSIATIATCHVNCKYYTWDGKTKPDSEPIVEPKPKFKKPKKSQHVVQAEPKIGRNDPCKCGSGKKYKKCCAKNQ